MNQPTKQLARLATQQFADYPKKKATNRATSNKTQPKSIIDSVAN